MYDFAIRCCYGSFQFNRVPQSFENFSNLTRILQINRLYDFSFRFVRDVNGPASCWNGREILIEILIYRSLKLKSWKLAAMHTNAITTKTNCLCDRYDNFHGTKQPQPNTLPSRYRALLRERNRNFLATPNVKSAILSRTLRSNSSAIPHI